MNSIGFTRDEHFVLISYEAKAPPRLWEFRGKWGNQRSQAELCLEHTYVQVHFASLPSTFGGHNDEFVLRATIAGDIYFWRTSTGHLLTRIQSLTNVGQLTAFAWNRGAKEWMLATGSYEGAVHFWAIPSPSRPRADAPLPSRPCRTSAGPSWRLQRRRSDVH
ncbi:hypothetical protein EIP86_008711 [Pleurotus ostreatoroseus]|nr:hypothetical protein EIP86_008711 [Pleurotus ostreatoroseus]